MAAVYSAKLLTEIIDIGKSDDLTEILLYLLFNSHGSCGSANAAYLC